MDTDGSTIDGTDGKAFCRRVTGRLTIEAVQHVGAGKRSQCVAECAVTAVK